MRQSGSIVAYIEATGGVGSRGGHFKGNQQSKRSGPYVDGYSALGQGGGIEALGQEGFIPKGIAAGRRLALSTSHALKN